PPEGTVAPARRKIDEIVLVEISVDQPGQRQEREVVAIDRMGDQQRIAWRRFNGPEVIELDDKGVVLEQRRAGDLPIVVEVEWRARIARDCAARQLKIPRERAILDLEIGDQRNQEAVRHRIDEGRALLDRELLLLQQARER